MYCKVYVCYVKRKSVLCCAMFYMCAMYCNESNSCFCSSGWRISKVVNMTDTAAGSMESAGWKKYNLGDDATNDEV